MINPLVPVEPPFSAEVSRILARYPKRDGYLLDLFRVFAISKRFLEKGTVNLLDRAARCRCAPARLSFCG